MEVVCGESNLLSLKIVMCRHGSLRTVTQITGMGACTSTRPTVLELEGTVGDGVRSVNCLSQA